VTAEEVAAFDRALEAGGVGLFPADTVYGLAVDAHHESAFGRLEELKGRPPAKPAAVMFLDPELAIQALAGAGPRTRAAVARLLPGPATVVVPNPDCRYPLACLPAPERLGIRVPALDGELEPLLAIRRPLIQSSANPSGGPDPRRLDDVDPRIRSGVDAELDAGELPGTPSTVVDLTDYERAGEYAVLREGAIPREVLAEVL
jgi:L-threonylcarbamoyladenylate synthase